MKEIRAVAIMIISVVLAVVLALFFLKARNKTQNMKSAPKIADSISNVQDNSQQKEDIKSKDIYFQSPLDRAGERVTKKKFGQFITPQNSPVQPERFSGYHTGTDFEIFPEELDIDVLAKAICDGKIVAKRVASGYGGILVQNCNLESQPVNVLYGHLKLVSISKSIGDDLSAGEPVGFLGKAYSSETDGERKHLHLGIHKGNSIDIHGYVQNQSELSGWIDPCDVGSVCL